jgi:carotenoid cleavage dioxygenase
LTDRPRLERWTIDPQARKVLTETIDDRGTEFPRGDERLTSRRHRYGFTIGTSSVLDLGALGDDPRTAVRKHDLVGGTTVEMDLGPGRIASEMAFVPAGSAAGEDDGWLMGYVYDAARGASDLVIIDAHDFGHPVATVHLPVRVPQGFHGNWIPDSALA